MSVKILAATHFCGKAAVSLVIEDHRGALILSRRDSADRPLGSLRIEPDELPSLIDAITHVLSALRRPKAS